MEFIYSNTKKITIAEIDFVFKSDHKYSNLKKENIADKLSVTWNYNDSLDTYTIIVGLGEKEEINLETIRKVAGAVAQSFQTVQIKEVQVDLNQLYSSFTHPVEVVKAWVEGTKLGSYSYDKYKSKKAVQSVETFYLIGEDISNQIEDEIQDTIVRAESVCKARDLANAPANELTPKTFVEKIKAMFKDTDVGIQVFDGEQIIQNQFVGLQHVGGGSKDSPAMVQLTYSSDQSKKHIALVGKGVTFDMGGMSLKVARDLSEARFDMGGASAVLGSILYLATQKKSANVTGLIMIAENVPDANAYLPSSVIEYPNGVTVEVANTDAEGRLILADGLIYSESIQPDEVIDICTLTGSVGIALGSDMAGVWSTGEIGKSLQAIGNENGDLIWELPLVYDYKRYLASDYADYHNIGSTHEGGATVAALFLHNFAPKNIPWAHIDMAATIQSRENKGYLKKGATGYGVRLLSDYILSKN